MSMTRACSCASSGRCSWNRLGNSSWLPHLPHRSHNEKDLYGIKAKTVVYDRSTGFIIFTYIRIQRYSGRNTTIEGWFLLLFPAGEAEDDRQAGGHQSEAEGRDGPLQEDHGQALAQSPRISEGKGIHAGGEAAHINRHVFGPFPSSPPCFLADWRSSPGAGVPAVFQAGDGAPRTGKRAVRVQRQDQRDGNGKWSQTAETGFNEHFGCLSSWNTFS